MLPQLDPTWYASQSFWTIITFITMFFIVLHFIIPSMRATVGVRRSQIEKDIKETEALKAQVKTLMEELESVHGEIRMRTQQIYAQAQQEAQELTGKMQEEFDRRLSSNLAEQERALLTAKATALKEITSISTILTKEAAQKIAGISLSEAEIKETAQAGMEKKE